MKNRPFKYGTQIAFRETINGLLWCIAAFSGSLIIAPVESSISFF